jgi:hypothetical protein
MPLRQWHVAATHTDQKLDQAGWVVQDFKQLNLGAAVGVAVREYPTDTGPGCFPISMPVWPNSKPHKRN